MLPVTLDPDRLVPVEPLDRKVPPSPDAGVALPPASDADTAADAAAVEGEHRAAPCPCQASPM